MSAQPAARTTGFRCKALRLGDIPVQLVDNSHSLQTQTTQGDSSTQALSTSASTWLNRTNPAGTQHTYQLWIGDKSDPANKIDITPDDNSAAIRGGRRSTPTLRRAAKITATA